ncbi:MAG: hypothetical protein WKF88_06740 [Ferruginibacter sp.]
MKSILSCYFLASVLLLWSCNDDKKTDTDVSKDSSAVVSTEPVSTNMIVTTPQNMVMVKHRVKDFAKWKVGYDSHDSMRLANGLHNYVVARGFMDSTMVMVAMRADDLTKAKAFAKDPALKAAMQKSGVTTPPTISFTILTYQDTSVVTGPARSMTRFMVKDWAAWEKNFLEGTAERTENGLALRAYGHDADDNNKVTVVTTILDSAKASNYWVSDKLKARRAAGGVIGTPERFLYRVVQRY